MGTCALYEKASNLKDRALGSFMRAWGVSHAGGGGGGTRRLIQRH